LLTLFCANGGNRGFADPKNIKLPLPLLLLSKLSFLSGEHFTSNAAHVILGNLTKSLMLVNSRICVVGHGRRNKIIP